ncbi:MAG: DUF378 domain-containing protein [Candidatus Pacebacteria bacterium]|nr:DUF378 domain-containing protein [Candidatus Paceibacterota bacterium]
MKLNWLDIIALVLVIVGGLNWGLVGLFSYDLVAQLFAGGPGGCLFGHHRSQTESRLMKKLKTVPHKRDRF